MEATLLDDYLSHSATRSPDKVALVCHGARFTYRQLDQAANQLAHALLTRGVGRGDRVLVFADNNEATVIAFWAALKAGAIISPVSPQTKVDKLRYYLRDLGARALISEARLAPVYRPAANDVASLGSVIVHELGDRNPGPHEIGWEQALGGEPATAPPRRNLDIDLAAILYTSGSTGAPKGVMLTHRNMLAAASSITSYLENTEDDIILCALPLSFDYGLYQMIMAFRMGARLVLERSLAYPAEIIQRMEQERVTGLPGVPTLFAMLGELKTLGQHDLSALRYLTNTAAALPVKQIEHLVQLFPQAKLYSMYGLTECKRCTYLPPADLARKPTSVGIAIPNTELWIVDENDHRLGPGETGQLVIRGATVMRGYWNKPEQTAKKLRPGPLPGEMVLYTGDYCRLDDDGYLYFVSRMDDIIKSRGEKVAPKEVEHALMNQSGVKEAAVIGVPDPLLGQAIYAFVVPERGKRLNEQTLLQGCQAALEPFMVPRYMAFVDDLPRTSTGKVDKQRLHA